MRVALLTNRTTAAERRRITAGLEAGEIDILLGTHALLYGDARFSRLGLVSNAWAEVRQGAIGPGVLFDLLPVFDTESNRYVVEQIASTMQGVDLQLVDDGVRGAFQRWVGAPFVRHGLQTGGQDGQHPVGILGTGHRISSLVCGRARRRG